VARHVVIGEHVAQSGNDETSARSDLAPVLDYGRRRLQRTLYALDALLALVRAGLLRAR
jgi:hypothetical protein